MALTNEDKLARLQKVLDQNGNAYEISDVIDEIRQGKLFAFENEHGCCIVQIVPLPRKKVLNVFAVIGEMEVIASLQDEVEAFGKRMGCDVFYTEGRAGWQKVLPHYGWTDLGNRSHLMKELK